MRLAAIAATAARYPPVTGEKGAVTIHARERDAAAKENGGAG